MRKPTTVIIEITAEKYTHKILDDHGEVIWSDFHNMVSAGEASGSHESDSIFNCKDLEPFDDLVSSMEDLSFGPFDVAGALYRIAEDF